MKQSRGLIFLLVSIFTSFITTIFLYFGWIPPIGALLVILGLGGLSIIKLNNLKKLYQKVFRLLYSYAVIGFLILLIIRGLASTTWIQAIPIVVNIVDILGKIEIILVAHIIALSWVLTALDKKFGLIQPETSTQDIPRENIRGLKWLPQGEWKYILAILVMMVIAPISILVLNISNSLTPLLVGLYILAIGFLLHNRLRVNSKNIANILFSLGFILSPIVVFYENIITINNNLTISWFIVGFVAQCFLLSYRFLYNDIIIKKIQNINLILYTLTWGGLGIGSLLKYSSIIEHPYRYTVVMSIWSIITFIKYQKVKLKVYPMKVIKSNKHNLDKFIVAISILIFIGFGIYHLGQFMSVDEPKWVKIRVPQLYTAVLEGDWASTYINDKPGVLPSALAGIVNLFLDHNIFQADPIRYEDYLFLWRLPIVLFNAGLLYVIYLLLSKLFGIRSAVVTTFLISTNPTLVGISQIVNPDATLWTTTFISFLAFFLYLKQNQQKYLFLSGIFLGVSLVSKFFASILFLIYVVVIAFEYLNKQVSLEHFKRRILDILKLTATTILIYTILFPATWVDPTQIITGSIGSGILRPGLPFFYIFLFLMFLFTLVLDSGWIKKIITKISFSWILGLLLSTGLSAIFVFLMINIFEGNTFFDFNQYVYFEYVRRGTNYWGDIISSFYIMFLSLPLPIVIGLFLLPLYYLLEKNVFKRITSDYQRLFILSSIVFVLVFIIGSSFGGYIADARYQIMLYPIYILLAVLVFDYFFQKVKFFYLGIIVISFYSTFSAVPYYYQYSNELNRNDYVISNAWGFGGYELAQKMNKTPDLQDRIVWSDREGFNEFYTGVAEWKRGVDPFESTLKIEYLVLTLGGERIFSNALNMYNQGQRGLEARVAGETPLLEYYQKEPIAAVCLHNNPNDCVRLVKVKDEDKTWLQSPNGSSENNTILDVEDE